MRPLPIVPLLLLLTACVASGQAAGPPPIAQQGSTGSGSHPAAGVPLVHWTESTGRQEIRLVDPGTGTEIPGSAVISLGEGEFLAPYLLSSGGTRLAAIESSGQSCESYAGGTACRGNATVLHLVDLQRTREVTATLPGKGWAGPMAFSPDASRFALAYHARDGSALLLFDAAGGTLVARRALPFRPSFVAFPADGTTLVVYGVAPGTPRGTARPEAPRVQWLDAATLDLEWEQALPDLADGDWCQADCSDGHEQRLTAAWTPALVLAPGRRALHIVHPGEDRLTTVDYDRRRVESVELRTGQAWLDRLRAFFIGVAEAKGGLEGARKMAAISQDGRRLFIVGQGWRSERTEEGFWETTEEPLGLQVVEVATGRIVAARESRATGIRISPDDAFLLLDGWERQPWTEVLDATSLEPVARLAGWAITISRRGDGSPAILAGLSDATQTHLALLDPRTFEVAHSWTVDSRAAWAGE